MLNIDWNFGFKIRRLITLEVVNLDIVDRSKPLWLCIAYRSLSKPLISFLHLNVRLENDGSITYINYK